MTTPSTNNTMRHLNFLLVLLLLTNSAVAHAQSQPTEGPPTAAGDTDGGAVDSPAYHEARLEQTWGAVRARRAAARRQGERDAAAERQMAAADGTNVFHYGNGEPIVVRCAPLRVTDVALQRGERLQGARAGDSHRWEINLDIVSGRAGALQHHVTLKPLAGATSTNLLLYTDRRTYELRLEPVTEREYMARVTFRYLDEMPRQLAEARRVRAELDEGRGGRRRRPGTPAEGGAEAEGDEIPLNPSTLSFNYSIEKEGRRRARRAIDWAPERVFTDGRRTWIEMPRAMRRSEAPVLIAQENGRDRVVNYRLRGRHFIVDRVLREAVLVRGTGREQQRVRIQREQD